MQHSGLHKKRNHTLFKDVKYSEIDYIAGNKGNINTFLQATFINLNTVTLKKSIKKG